MTVIFGNVTIECTPEEFKRLIELDVIKNDKNDCINNNFGVITDYGVQTPPHTAFPPYLDLPKK